MPLDKVTLFDEKSLNHISRAFRNLISNGGMHIHKKGINKTNITQSGIYTADNWLTTVLSLGNWTNTIENDAPLNTGLRKSFKMTCSIADNSPVSESYCVIQQQLEGQQVQTLKKGTDFAESFTLSFWVKSNFIGRYIIEIVDVDNNRNISSSYLINVANTWEKKNITLPGDKLGIIDNDANISLYINFWLASGTNYSSGKLSTNWENISSANRSVGQINLAKNINNYFQITGIQMEIGAVSTNFEFLPYNLQSVINSQPMDGSKILTDLVSFNETGEIKTSFKYPLIFSTDNIERLRINANGNIGVNTKDPIASLHVSGSYLVGNGPHIFLENTNNNSAEAFGPGLMLKTGRNGDSSLFIGTYQNNGRFNVSLAQSPWTELFTILQNGNVGIGEKNPGSKLHITDLSSPPIANRHMLYLGTTVGWSSITHNLSNGSYNPISINGDIGLIFSGSTINTGSMIIAPWSNNQTGIRITPTAVNIFNANGIKFSPNQVPSTDVNTLDDYEEGSWTPVVTGGASGVTVSAIYNAQYTKIGRQVTTMTYFQLNNTSGAVQPNVYIGGLPYPSQGVYGFVSGHYGVANNIKSISATAYVEMGTTFFYLLNLNLPIGASLHMYYISYFTN